MSERTNERANKRIYIARLKAYTCMLNLPRLAENGYITKETKTKPIRRVRPGVSEISPVINQGKRDKTKLLTTQFIDPERMKG